MGLFNHTLPPAAASSPRTPLPAAPGGARFYSEQLETATRALADANRQRSEANARVRVAEAKAKRESELAAKRLIARDKAQESERAWREQLLAAEDEGGVGTPALRVIGKEAREGTGRAPWPQWMLQLILARSGSRSRRLALTPRCLASGWRSAATTTFCRLWLAKSRAGVQERSF